MAAVTKMKPVGNNAARRGAVQTVATSAKVAKSAKAAKAAKSKEAAKAAKSAKSATSKSAKSALRAATEINAAPAAGKRMGRGDNAAAPLVRDTFRMPRREFDRLRALKQRARALGRPVKKSELLRAGLQLLGAADDAVLLAVLGQLARD